MPAIEYHEDAQLEEELKQQEKAQSALLALENVEAWVKELEQGNMEKDAQNEKVKRCVQYLKQIRNGYNKSRTEGSMWYSIADKSDFPKRVNNAVEILIILTGVTVHALTNGSNSGKGDADELKVLDEIMGKIEEEDSAGGSLHGAEDFFQEIKDKAWRADEEEDSASGSLSSDVDSITDDEGEDENGIDTNEMHKASDELIKWLHTSHTSLRKAEAFMNLTKEKKDTPNIDDIEAHLIALAELSRQCENNDGPVQKYQTLWAEAEQTLHPVHQSIEQPDLDKKIVSFEQMLHKHIKSLRKMQKDAASKKRGAD